jgi:hypothetical protein
VMTGDSAGVQAAVLAPAPVPPSPLPEALEHAAATTASSETTAMKRIRRRGERTVGSFRNDR